jgi:hypothetical protein
MLIACHLFVGTLTRIILQNHFKSRYLLPLCMVGSVLPDIIDKPLGYIVLPDLGDGRLIAHALAGIILISIIGLCLFRSTLLTGALITGVISHQILDEMWNIPINWFYPLLGPFPVYLHENYFGWGLMKELTTPSEWAFSLAILFLLYIRSSESASFRVRTAAFSSVPALLLLITGR